MWTHIKCSPIFVRGLHVGRLTDHMGHGDACQVRMEATSMGTIGFTHPLTQD